MIKSFVITPEKIHERKNAEVMLLLEIDCTYSGLVDRIHLDLSKLTDNHVQPLYDDGTNGDLSANDCIYTFKVSIKVDNFIGELPVEVTVETTIPGFELNTTSILVIEEVPENESEPLVGIYAGIIIISILVIIVSREKRTGHWNVGMTED